MRDFAFPALKANALYEGKYPLHSALSRPLIAKKMVEVAKQYGRQGGGARLHGQRQRPGAHRRVGALPRPLHHRAGPGPGVEHDPSGAAGLSGQARGIDLPLTKKNPYSIDENLWGRAIECGELEDPWAAAPAGAFRSPWTRRWRRTSRWKWSWAWRRAYRCRSTARRMDPVELVEKLDAIAGAHGFGRVDMVENRLVGIKSREVYEVPGSLSLIMAHREAGGPHPHPGAAALQDHDRSAADRAHLRRPVVQPAGRVRCGPSSMRARSASPVKCGCSTSRARAGPSGRRSPNSLYVEQAGHIRLGRHVQPSSRP